MGHWPLAAHFWGRTPSFFLKMSVRYFKHLMMSSREQKHNQCTLVFGKSVPPGPVCVPRTVCENPPGSGQSVTSAAAASLQPAAPGTQLTWNPQTSGRREKEFTVAGQNGKNIHRAENCWFYGCRVFKVLEVHRHQII